MVLKYHDRDTGLGASEQLYTARGAQGFGTFDKISNYGVDPAKESDVVMLLYRASGKKDVNYKVRPLWTSRTTPMFFSMFISPD